MDIELDPPNGITGIQLGLSLGEAEAAAARYGRVSVVQPSSVVVDGKMFLDPIKVHAQGDDGFAVMLHLVDRKSVTAIEVWRAAATDCAEHVRYNGLEMFHTPALRLLEMLEERGLDIDRAEEPDSYAIHGLSLGFTRESGADVPLDVDGQPLYFQSVLVAGVSYFDEERDLWVPVE